MKADTSPGLGDAKASTCDGEGATLLSSRRGVERKLDANSKALPVSCWDTPAGSRSRKRGDSTEGSKLYLADVTGAGTPTASVGVLSFAGTDQGESRRTLVTTEGDPAVRLGSMT